MRSPKLSNFGISDPPDDAPGASWLEVRGRRVFGIWQHQTQRSGPSLVFLHDGLGSVGTMRKFPQQLSRNMGLSAFTFDRLGYGRSDIEKEFPADFMGEAAAFLEDVLDTAGIKDCCLIGHSDGGTVALLYGARYPGRVRAIVTIAAHVCRDELTYGQVLRHHKMYQEGTIPDWMVRFHGDRAAHLLRCWSEVWQKTLYDSWDICEEIRDINVPLLAMQGSQDAYGLPSQLDGIKCAVPTAEIEMINGLGHFPQLEDPEKVVTRISKFLGLYCR